MQYSLWKAMGAVTSVAHWSFCIWSTYSHFNILGAADLEKVTDYAEEKEIGSSSDALDAITSISK